MIRLILRPSVADMRRHIFELWGGEDEIDWCQRPSRAHAIRGAGVIRIAPIKSVISYATALHEIGHIYGRHQQSRRAIVRERWAWKWARQNALAWDHRMERCARASLAWYAARDRWTP